MCCITFVSKYFNMFVDYLEKDIDYSGSNIYSDDEIDSLVKRTYTGESVANDEDFEIV